MPNEMRICSVRELVGTVFSGGSIDTRTGDFSVRQEGARIHRKIQKSMGEGYESEVALQLELPELDIPLQLQGRADGVFTDESGLLTVDEIKTTLRGFAALQEAELLHLAQAKCYAHMLLGTMQNPPDEIGVQLTYYELETEEIQRKQLRFTASELELFFGDLLEQYLLFPRLRRDWALRRNASLAALRFPYPSYRAGQRKLAAAVYQSIRAGSKLYLQAPTGIGKTSSTLFPSLKAMGEGECDKLFYLTAKTITRTVAEDALLLMQEQGLQIKSITLRAKDKICPCPGTACNPEECSYANGHYDRVKAALLEIWERETVITPEITSAYALRHCVCPHEFSLDIALWADIVIGDYNHLFDPVAGLKRFFTEEPQENYVFLLDEAHNLADRVRDMYSLTLSQREFARAKRLAKGRGNPIRAAANAVIEYYKRVFLEYEGRQALCLAERDDSFGELVEAFHDTAQEYLGEHADAPAELWDLFFATHAFLRLRESYDECFCTIYEFTRTQTAITVFCIDPSHIIREKLNFAVSSVLFSATLSPLPYYREILGGEEEDGLLSLPSPFPQENLLLLAHRGISTKFADRPDSLLPIAQSIAETVARHTGNYLIFFPSFRYLRDVEEQFRELYPQYTVLTQQSSMAEEERAEFLARFESEKPECLLGFCVLGGIFSEGIDLAGDRLCGAIIVGVGLPQINVRLDVIRDYFTAKNGRGYDFAYVFPGMNKVLQAAGRVIRTEQDRGVVLLLDTRYARTGYRSLFPQHWAGLQYLSDTAELAQACEAFW